MRRITIYQRGSSNIDIIDDSEVAMEEYCQELSKLFQMSNISILKASQATFIGRPSKISGIVVQDLETNEQVKVQNETIRKKEKVEEPKKPVAEIHEDIITDMD